MAEAESEPLSGTIPESEPESYPEGEAEESPPEPEWGSSEPEGPGSEPEGEYGCSETGTCPEPEVASIEPEALTEPNALAEFGSEEEKVLWISLYVICMVLIVIGDILIIITILRNKKLRRKAASLYLLSLIFARTLIGIFVVPTRITASFSEEYVGSIACKLCHFSALGSSTTSILSVVAVAVVKLRECTNVKMAGGSQKGRKKTVHVKEVSTVSGDGKIDCQFQDVGGKGEEPDDLKGTFLSILALWFVGHLYGIRAAFVNDIVETVEDTTWSCTLMPSKAYLNKFFIMMDFGCLFLMPFCVIVVCYLRVIKVTSNMVSCDVISEEQNRTLPTITKEMMKTSTMLVVLVILFFLCNLPPYVVKMVRLWGESGGSGIGASLEQSLYLASYSNSWLNVLVYLVFRRDLREGLKDLCCCMKAARAGHQSLGVSNG